MTFGAKLRSARRDAGLTQKELATKIGAKHNSVSNWENDQNKPGPDTIELLCAILGVSPNYFFNGPNIDSPSNILPLPRTRKIPLLGDIACGEPIFAEENYNGEVDTPDNIHADFALRCKGDSMIGARIQDGDLVFIRKQEDVDNGEIAAVLVEDEATLKRVYKYPDKVVLSPENPKYPPLVYAGYDLEKVRILGKAVAFLSTV